MVASKEEVEPGGGLPQFPVTRQDGIRPQSLFLIIGFKPVVSPDPHALLFSWIDFTPALEATVA
jgi:hypothetical protein